MSTTITTIYRKKHTGMMRKALNILSVGAIATSCMLAGGSVMTTTVSMLFSFSATPPFPSSLLCCHLLSPLTSQSAPGRELCGVRGGVRWVGGWWGGGLWPVCSPGTHPNPIIQTPRAPVWHRPPHCTLLVPLSLPVAPRNPSFPQRLGLT